MTITVTGAIAKDGERLNTTRLEGRFRLWINQNNCAIHLLARSLPEIMIHEYQNEIFKDSIRSLSASMKCPGESWTLECLCLVFGFSDDDQAILRAWMADRLQVLHSLALNLPREHRECPLPLFQGYDQGLGKTQFVRALIKPFGDLAQEISVGDVLNDFSSYKWEEMLISFLDDACPTTKKQTEKFKKWFSSQTTNNRGMRKEYGLRRDKICAAIATSNPDKSELFPDPTGNRRVHQITPKHSMLNTIPLVDFLSIWRNIDPDFTLSHEEYRRMAILNESETAYDTWLIEEAPALMQSGNVRCRTPTVLYNSYIRYSESMREPAPLSSKAFSIRFAETYQRGRRSDCRYFNNLLA